MKKNVFAAVLCSAALACGMAMPAFAADPTVSTDTNGITADKGGTTLVQAYKADATIVDEVVSATVPVKVGVVLAENGFGEFIAPSASAYQITNTGTAAIKVGKASASVADSSWTLANGSLPNSAPTSGSTKSVSVKVNGSDPLNANGYTFNTAQAIPGNGGKCPLTLEGWTSMAPNTFTTALQDTTDLVNIVYTIVKA